MERSTLFLTYAPQPPLAEFVELFWYCHGYKPSHARELRLPTGTLELIINLRDDAFRVYDRKDANRVQCLRGSLVSGPRAEHSVIDTACQESVVGVLFKPGGALPILGFPTHELCNAHVALDDVWGAAADEMREQLLEAKTPQSTFHVLEQCLLARMIQSRVRHPAVVVALREFQRGPCSGTVGDVVAKSGFSQRRFIQVFREEVGMTPKLFCRLLRFQDVLRHVENIPKVDWANVALTCGYFDQGHLIRDFQEFAELSPATYLRRRGEHRNHLPLAD